MDILSLEELNRLRNAGESKLVEYKKAGDLNDHDEILRQLSAFSNRVGGTILYGIQDDGQIEGARIHADSTVEHISDEVQNRTSPVVEFMPLFYSDSDGDVLALRVLKRRGIPCAVVRRKYHEIENRRYFVRTNSGVRMMDDRTLEWLFLHQEDPVINESFRICIQYRRHDISLSTWIHLPMLLPQPELVGVFQALNREQRELLKSEESTNLLTFFAEIIPYAIIAKLSHIYSKSWKTRVHRLGNMTSWTNIPATSEEIDLHQFHSGEGALLQKMSFNINDIFAQNKTICLPKGTMLRIDIDEKNPRFASSVIHFTNVGLFKISIRISPSTWSVGAAPGHPLGAALGGLYRGDEQLAVQEQIAHSCLNIAIAADFEFPDEPSDEILEYFDWAQQLVSEIRAEWDWDRLVSSLPPGILYSIDRDVREILRCIKGTPPNSE